MQKTYDECYLICSTAVYFEGQVSYPTFLVLLPCFFFHLFATPYLHHEEQMKDFVTEIFFMGRTIE